MNMHLYDFVFFDLNGTLTDSGATFLAVSPEEAENLVWGPHE